MSFVHYELLSFQLCALQACLFIEPARHLSCAKFVVLFMMLHRVLLLPFDFGRWIAQYLRHGGPFCLFFSVRNSCRALHLVSVSSCFIVSVLCCGSGSFPAGGGRHRPRHSALGDRPQEWSVPADDVVALGSPGSDRSHVQNMHAS